VLRRGVCEHRFVSSEEGALGASSIPGGMTIESTRLSVVPMAILWLIWSNSKVMSPVQQNGVLAAKCVPTVFGNLVGGLTFTGLTLHATHARTAPKRRALKRAA
jgi:hypothetical protein